MLATRIRSIGAAHWLSLYGGILAAWAALFVLSWSSAAPTGLWAAICTVTPDMAGYVRTFAMWALMSAAMMLPTALPAFATYDDLSAAGADTELGHLVAGYLAVWLGFSALAAGLQLILVDLGQMGALDGRLRGDLAAGLLAMAGLYQLSALKAACLEKCRAPLPFFMRHWDEGGVRNGLRLGLVCLGCCWALMLLALVGGTMSLAFMGLATLLMTLEKLPEIGRWLTWPLGSALISAALVVWLV